MYVSANMKTKTSAKFIVSRAVRPKLLGALFALCIAPLTLSATPLIITSASFSGTGLSGSGTSTVIAGGSTDIVTGITTSAGTYTNLIGGTATTATASFGINSSPTVSYAAEANVTTATLCSVLSGLTVTDGTNNNGYGSASIQFGQVISSSDNLFIIESTAAGGTFDAGTVNLIDATGKQVGTYALSWNALSTTVLASITFNSSGSGGGTTITQNATGITFSLADFTGTGDLSTATGISYTSTGLDPLVFGDASSTPEPTAYALLLGSALLFLILHKRKSDRLA